MILKKVFIISLFSFLVCFLISCNQPKKEKIIDVEINDKEHIENFTLSNTLYLLAPDFNSKDCEAFGECDCCTSNYLFLDNKTFIAVDYCLGVDTYYSGKYNITDGKVQLKYNTTIVQKEYNWESETDTINKHPKYFYKTENCKSFENFWKKLDCKGKVYFKNIDQQTQYATIDKTQTAKSFLIKLKEEEIWKKLNIK